MYNFEFLNKGHDRIPAEDAVKIKKSGVRINSALRHIAPLRSYVKIGIDAKTGVGCIKPVKDANNAFKVGTEFGRKVAGKLMEVVGEHPIASVENGMIILRPRYVKPTAQPKVKEEVKEEVKPPKRKPGRPPKPKRVLTVVKETPKERCENCAYHAGIEGKTGQVRCTKHNQTRSIDSFCFHYKSEADAKTEAEAELALRNRIMQGV